MDRLRLGFVYVVLLLATWVASPVYSNPARPDTAGKLGSAKLWGGVSPQIPSNPRVPPGSIIPGINLDWDVLCLKLGVPCEASPSSSPVIPTAQPSTGLSYAVVGPGLIDVTIDTAQIPAGIMASAEVAALRFVTELQNNQKNYELTKASSSYSESYYLADDYLLQDDLEAELRWWGYLDYTMKTAGVIGLAAGATALTNQLQQLNALPPARVVLVITLMSAFVAESAIRAVEDKQTETRLRITELKKEIDQESWRLFWELEGGVPATKRPWLDFSPCIYENFCNYSQVCVTNGATGAKDCGERTIACEERLVSCPN